METPTTTTSAMGTGEGSPLSTGGAKLISSNQVQGTEVYGPGGEHVGEIDHLMIEKVSGRVAYAVMSFGGFLGMGKDFHPIPWNALQYDTTLDGYRTDITREQVQGAPGYAGGEAFDWNDEAWHSRVHSHYKTQPSFTSYM